MKKRQKIGRRLSGAGLRQPDQIAAGENGRNGVALDRRGFGQALSGNIIDDARRQPEFEKRVARKRLRTLIGCTLIRIGRSVSIGLDIRYRHISFRRTIFGHAIFGQVSVAVLHCGLDGHGHPSRKRSTAFRDTAAAIDPRLPNQCLC